ncbi:hypothetical protein BFU36_01960 [Sulfolobus sp. A20]|uniref:hypothetical protein n=1 Tax=Sulfolobaceae TaxID=118883 RepID=UPI0008461975|nr:MULTISPECIES: hypothetical protein [unclassified Sulfolobus]TRM78258.1 hypothetical protein DJ532_01535 [Sulfolobus sp. A20-N-F8]TRM78922.1 hypothetical protein DJ528_03515 [Sulfolobus sp. B5]TRM80796.1 hypothetical protein DJ531_11810 [Sulfolobus sp. A20-N-F6]TRM85445.1 hypothetical protein DJ522_00685 [Sulfolobus sp. F3]TRM85741.1 hypothetical protein DJ521_07210 [Sulfolobus sp. E3]TRM88497.1 hypothetical protein DJ529_05110 [Sulfolobus sp. C3]TRM91997.1 hypothetical protein DJ526_06460
MSVVQYYIDNLKFSIIYEENRTIIYMDINQEIKQFSKNKLVDDDKNKVIYVDMNEKISNGSLKKIIICKTRISTYLCNAIVEVKNIQINEKILYEIYKEVLEVSKRVI